MRIHPPVPVSRAPFPFPAATAPVVAAPVAASPRPTALVVEDDPAIRMVERDLLEDAGLDVEDAGDAERALALLSDMSARRRRPAVMVTDLDLGEGLDGLALADVARRRVPGLGVVFVTGSPERVLARGAGPGPRERVLGKPFANAELVATVRSLATAAAPSG